MNTQSFESHTYFIAYKISLSLRKCKEMSSEPEFTDVVTTSQEVLKI